MAPENSAFPRGSRRQSPYGLFNETVNSLGTRTAKGFSSQRDALRKASAVPVLFTYGHSTIPAAEVLSLSTFYLMKQRRQREVYETTYNVTLLESVRASFGPREAGVRIRALGWGGPWSGLRLPATIELAGGSGREQ